MAGGNSSGKTRARRMWVRAGKSSTAPAVGTEKGIALDCEERSKETRFGKEVILVELRRYTIHLMAVSGDVQERFFHAGTILLRVI